MVRHERKNPWQCREERPRQVGERRIADDDQERHAVLGEGCKLVRLVANAPIVRKGDPTAGGHLAQPLFVRRIRSEVIAVALYAKAGITEDGGELQAEIAIAKEDNTQATRS
jgi:hypothetical protein